MSRNGYFLLRWTASCCLYSVRMWHCVSDSKASNGQATQLNKLLVLFLLSPKPFQWEGFDHPSTSVWQVESVLRPSKKVWGETYVHPFSPSQNVKRSDRGTLGRTEFRLLELQTYLVVTGVALHEKTPVGCLNFNLWWSVYLAYCDVMIPVCFRGGL